MASLNLTDDIGLFKEDQQPNKLGLVDDIGLFEPDKSTSKLGLKDDIGLFEAPAEPSPSIETEKPDILKTFGMPEDTPWELLQKWWKGEFDKAVPPGQKPALWPLHKTIPSEYSRTVEPLGSIFGTPEKVIDVSATGLIKSAKHGLRVMDLIGKRRANIDKAVLDSESFIRQFERDFSKAELEAIPFIRQKIKDPKILKQVGRQDLVDIIERPSAELLQATEKIGKYYDEAHVFLKENWGDVGFVEDYVTHIWDIPKGRKSEIIRYFATRNPFTKKRVIPTLEEGIKFGLKPKTTNIAKLLRIYDQYKIKTAFNMQFAKGLKGLVDEAGEPLIKRYDKAPEDWITIKHPALERAMMIGKLKDGKGIILRKAAVSVHPDIAKEVKIIFDKPISHAAIGALETVNAFTKKAMLSVSFFHHQALTESAISSGIGRKALKMWNPFKVIKALKNKDYDIYRQMPLTKDAIDHGVMFGALEDVQRGRVRQSLQGLEKITKDIPIAKHLTKGIRKGNELWDAALWDYYHNNLKLYAYEENVFRALKRTEKNLGRELNAEEVTAIKNEMGKFVNDSFGGQNWELNKVLGNPKTRQMMHWLLLAPDWTLSVLKQAAAPIKGIYLQGIGKKLAGKALTKRGALFWTKAVFTYNAIAQSVNYYNTKKEYGEGRFTWENAPGHTLNIFIGRNPDGTERYLRMGKQFREVMEWSYEPERKLGAKLSPALREGIRQIAKHDPGSGFPTEFEEQKFFESIPERLKSIAEMPIPFSLRGYVQSRPGAFMLTFPTSRGMTNYKTIKLFKKALVDGDEQRVQRIFISALENNLDADQLITSAAAAVKADITYDNKRLARDMLIELESIDDEQARWELLDVYRQKGILTPEVEKQLDKLLKTKERVQQQKEMLIK